MSPTSFILIFAFTCLLWRVMAMKKKPLWTHALANLCPPWSADDDQFALRLFYPLIGMWRGLLNPPFSLILTLILTLIDIVILTNRHPGLHATRIMFASVRFWRPATRYTVWLSQQSHHIVISPTKAI